MFSGTSPARSGPGTSAGASGFRKYIVWFIIGLIVAIALGATAAVTTPSSSFPITVDGGTTTTTEYSGAKSLGFTSGSLYSTPGDNLATYVITDNLAGKKGFWFCGKIESTKVDAFPTGPVAGSIKFSVNRIVNKIPGLTNAELVIRSNGSAFTHKVITGVDSGEIDPDQFGILVSTKWSAGGTFNGKPGIVTEFAIPLSAAAKTSRPTEYPIGGPYRINSLYSTSDISTNPIQVTDGVVSVNSVVIKNKTTYEVVNDAFFVPGKTGLEVGNIGSLDPTKNGTVQVIVRNVPNAITAADLAAAVSNGLISTRDFTRNPTAESALNFLDGGTLGIGDFFTSGAHPKSGALRLNADGTQDIVLQFAVTSLVNQPVFFWGPDTQTVEIAGVVGSFYLASKTDITISGK